MSRQPKKNPSEPSDADESNSMDDAQPQLSVEPNEQIGGRMAEHARSEMNDRSQSDRAASSMLDSSRAQVNAAKPPVRADFLTGAPSAYEARQPSEARRQADRKADVHSALVSAVRTVAAQHGLDVGEREVHRAMGRLLTPMTAPGGSGAFALMSIHHTERVTSVAAYSTTIAVTSDDKDDVMLWDVSNGKKKKLKNHDAKAACVAIGGGRLASAGYDSVVLVWDLKPKAGDFPTATALPDFNGHQSGGRMPQVWAVAVSNDGKRVLSATNDGEILLWDTDTGTICGRGSASTEPVAGLSFVGANNLQFLSGHSDGKMFIWDIPASVMPPKPLPASSVALAPGTPFDHHNNHPVNSVAASPDGKIGLSASFDMTLKLWDLTTSDPNPPPTKTMSDHKNWVWRVAFAPDGKTFASASEDGTIRIWKSDGSKSKAFSESGGVMGVAYGDGATVFYTTGDTSDPEVKPVTVPSL